MKKITALVRNGTTEIFLEKPLVTEPESTMIIKNVTIYWHCKNVVENVNDTVVKGASVSLGSTVTFDPGYWTFDMIRDKLKENNVKIERLPYSNKCRIFPIRSNLHLQKFGPLIGFPETEELTADVWESSPYVVDVNQGLRYVMIHSDIVNTFKTYDHTGARSNVVATIPITTEQILNGSVTTYPDLDSEVYVYNGNFNKVCFHVDTNIPKKVDITVLFDAYIK